ncbi:MAG: hypothetical protein EA341_06475 [Mongoliibacter sp.]|jgi:hypothetical protein|uniref:nuclear transport factor 2 family protein n=1 Tax=Mongoliibacter sp. TaxID=2022438 RepID=UPI0012F44025|nr:nuclear transport factor 2 family protein [Mongoliibacter sp.]TVP51012.1 MAG: hypothetical protein EA341_06475 [Mongoliibacter sp.]
MKNLIIFSLLIFGVFQQQCIAQEEKNVEKVISTLFEGMKNKDVSLIEPAFHKNALMHTVKSDDSSSTLGVNSVSDFINRIATTPANTILDERILDYQIKIDGDMASAWTPYEFYVNDGFSHCGVNSFQLIKTVEGWKITYIIDTRRKTGC